MRIAKRLEEQEAAAAGGASDGAQLRRNGQLPPIARKGSDPGPLTREKEGLLTPAIPTPPNGAKSTKRSPKAAAAAPAPADGEKADKDKKKQKQKKKKEDKDKKKDPLEGRKLQVLSYVVFLCVFVMASANGRTPDMYYQNSVVETYMSLGQVRRMDPADGIPACDLTAALTWFSVLRQTGRVYRVRGAAVIRRAGQVVRFLDLDDPRFRPWYLRR